MYMAPPINGQSVKCVLGSSPEVAGRGPSGLSSEWVGGVAGRHCWLQVDDRDHMAVAELEGLAASGDNKMRTVIGRCPLIQTNTWEQEEGEGGTDDVKEAGGVAVSNADWELAGGDRPSRDLTGAQSGLK